LAVCKIEKLVPAPTSVPKPTLTGYSVDFACSNLKSPLPKNKFEVGQKAIADFASERRLTHISY
jgi:hypothetical protein